MLVQQAVVTVALDWREYLALQRLVDEVAFVSGHRGEGGALEVRFVVQPGELASILAISNACLQFAKTLAPTREVAAP